MKKEIENSCPACAKTPPCSKYCGKCGNLVHEKLLDNKMCYYSHLGYKTEGGHLFCPDCGINLK